MSVVERLRILHRKLEDIASDLPSEEMFFRFNEAVVYSLEHFIEEIEEAEG